jgi:hypothetical protein
MSEVQSFAMRKKHMATKHCTGQWLPLDKQFCPVNCVSMGKEFLCIGTALEILLWELSGLIKMKIMGHYIR